MRKKISIILAVIICICPTVSLASDASVTSNDLINNAGDFDGKEIVYTGEVIGDILSRGEYSWINVSDGSNAIGIWAKGRDVLDIKIAGRYDAHGDTIRIMGIFHRACAEHGGDFDIHAESIELVEKGYNVNHVIEPIRVLIGTVLFLLALICLGVVIKKREVKITAKQVR